MLSPKPAKYTINADVIRMWKNGCTGNYIAKTLGATRSQVMGVVHRAKKKGELQAHPVEKKEKLEKPTKPKREKKPDGVKTIRFRPGVPLPVRFPSAKSITDIGFRECRYIVDDGLFCAEPSGKHMSWCSHHHSIVFTKSERRRDKRNEVLMHRMKFNF